MNPLNFFRSFAAMMGLAPQVKANERPTKKKIVPTTTVVNRWTGKVVDVPTHNLQYFLNRRTDRWQPRYLKGYEAL